jgi:hypothetical protein
MPKRQRGGPDQPAAKSAAESSRSPRELRVSVPWYEGTLLWGSLGLFAALVITVIAVERDLRWLLIPAWPCACLAAWAAFRSVQPSGVAWLLIAGSSLLAAGSLALISVKVVNTKAPASIMMAAHALGARENPLRDQPNTLMQIYREHTDLQADKLAKAYLGKWIVVSRDITNISDVSGGTTPRRTMILSMEKTTFAVVTMIFNDKADELSLLRRGTHVKVIGQIAGINEINLRLDNCELLEP